MTLKPLRGLFFSYDVLYYTYFLIYATLITTSFTIRIGHFLMTKEQILTKVLQKRAGLSDNPAFGTIAGAGIGAGGKLLNNIATIGTAVGPNGTRPMFTGVGRAAGRGALVGLAATAIIRAMNLAHARKLAEINKVEGKND